MIRYHLIAVAFAASFAAASFARPSVASAQFYIEVEAGPPDIDEAPSTYYEGRPVYYYDGRWYYRHGPHWAYYREEPRPLVVYRASPAWRHYRHYEPRDHHDHHPPPPPGPPPHAHAEHHGHHRP